MEHPKTRAGKLLKERGMWFREVPQDDRNERVCKTIMFKRKDNNERFACVVPYLSRVSYKKMRAHLGCEVSPLSVDELRNEGFEPHECAPMLMKCSLLVDSECKNKHPIQTGSGTVGYGIEWHFSDLEKIVPYETVDLQQKE